MPAPLYRPSGRRSPLRRRAEGGAQAIRAVGGLPPPVLEIPFSWIATPLTRKPTTAITRAEVGQAGGATALAVASDARVRQFGTNTARVTLDSAVDADAGNLATFLTLTQSVPRPRQPTLTFNLLARTDVECLLILGVQLAQRIRITGAPAGTPPGAVNFTVEGIAHTLGVDNRTVTWSTAALVGVPVLTNIATDDYTRTVAGGWSNATPTGQTWLNDYPDADANVAAGVGTLQPSILADNYNSWLAVGTPDAELRADFQLSTLPASGSLRFGLVARAIDGDNCYRYDADLSVSGNVTLSLVRVTAGVESTLASRITAGIFAGVWYTLRMRIYGTALQGRIWRTANLSPALIEITATDNSNMAGTSAGVFVRNNTALTTAVFSVDNVLIGVDRDTGGATAGPWFRWGSSVFSGPDVRPF
ncbi:MAG: hypothetical protein V4515_12740 [Chloroflexota bacterium]